MRPQGPWQQRWLLQITIFRPRSTCPIVAGLPDLLPPYRQAKEKKEERTAARDPPGALLLHLLTPELDPQQRRRLFVIQHHLPPSAASGVATCPGCGASRCLRGGGGDLHPLASCPGPPLLGAGVSLRGVWATAVLALGHAVWARVASPDPAALNRAPAVNRYVALLAKSAPRGSGSASGAGVAPIRLGSFGCFHSQRWPTSLESGASRPRSSRRGGDRFRWQLVATPYCTGRRPPLHALTRAGSM